MPDILHRVGIKSPSPHDVYNALTTMEGLSGWWTTTTQGESNVGGVINFMFGDRGRIDVKVVEFDPGRRVVWQVVGGPEDWIDSKVSFELRSEGEQTIVLFKHQGWSEQSEFMHHCSTKWASFLMSMKSLVETGEGAPFPDDVHVSLNWN